MLQKKHPHRHDKAHLKQKSQMSVAKNLQTQEQQQTYPTTPIQRIELDAEVLTPPLSISGDYFYEHRVFNLQSL